MTFFDTQAGYDFARYTIPSLERELEALNKKLNKKQYVESYTCDNHTAYTIQKEIERGAEVVSMVSTGKNIVVVFRK